MAGYQHLSEHALVEALRRGEDRALEEIFNRYWARLFSAAHKILDDEQTSQDIVQEIFIKLWERRAELQINNLGPYLSTALKFQVASYFRHHSFKLKHLAALQYLLSQQEQAPDDEIPDNIEVISRLMAALPARCREIFYMSRIQQLSNSEIAFRLNISIRTVETQISKALKQMRVSLNNPSAELVALIVSIAFDQSSRY